ncbi:MAG: tRNA uridine-5-carboxymethylaminomethyl(34) synthesis GTPase MnmE [Polaromonas sp. 24-62-144]|jgi:tRNA modification GTPase|uniref:tRNA uridine-5-carboxymethylaminomethyl(34) synthesis GTPase MnmE n=1 Tax=Polaromonas sp. TaxID=1869339 RepID=UPI000BCC4581|nr:tRNA uridine-5-carboxymethylaminomethyl(34) synthesis GTPase MnmE [Polaromonas sp.]OYZ84515.1 MAG: tRNA uridine-5-carboxymethylaminomethyl(34) synthesis GTPase MnmE [Polaromonas sp. 24-62-144]HQS32365.1 tRNA uridine-5-carboxymethylaminomethyl(34) synthesis GTPase MnmE [Polaromonas sp.]HQS91526.1 tRNA uridine-5-carboxymethylaminomethyl(34) synthesis GTPase MnmE [Polaromonas sp.]
MLTRHHDPIVATATAPGRGAVGIVRLSGRAIAPLVRALCGRDLLPRQATYLPFKDVNGQVIDQGLAIYFPAPHSYTGEDVLELQAHGGPMVLQLLLSACLEAGALPDPDADQPRLPRLRLARPGEFTERAFLNNKIDLAQAEGIADLIDASTETAARSAARSMTGEFSQAVTTLLEQLIHLRMLVEATLDFPEEDIDFLKQADARGQLQRLQETLRVLAQRAVQGAILREGIKVVIAGQPNAGKSSLLNALAGAELAIVTPIAGTTRDKVSQLIQIDGVPLHVVDTAGLREALDDVEKIGVERAWAEIRTADAVLFLHDLSRHDGATGSADAMKYIAADADIARTIGLNGFQSTKIIDVWNKSDLVSPATLAEPRPGVLMSARTGAGLAVLRQTLLEVVGWQASPDGLFMARERHVRALAGVQRELARAAAQLQAAQPALDLLAEDLRQAQTHLGEITGAFSSDDLLGEIFSRFCIGK